MKTTVWVYAKDEDEARERSNGEGGYCAWDDEPSAIRDGETPYCRLPGEELFRVTTIVAKVPARKAGA